VALRPSPSRTCAPGSPASKTDAGKRAAPHWGPLNLLGEARRGRNDGGRKREVGRGELSVQPARRCTS
jgi:hypothetical protein